MEKPSLSSSEMSSRRKEAITSSPHLCFEDSSCLFWVFTCDFLLSSIASLGTHHIVIEMFSEILSHCPGLIPISYSAQDNDIQSSMRLFVLLLIIATIVWSAKIRNPEHAIMQNANPCRAERES